MQRLLLFNPDGIVLYPHPMEVRLKQVRKDTANQNQYQANYQISYWFT
jgi:hypothetical protein